MNGWKHLLRPDEYKLVIIESLQWLIQNELLRLYGYVIMPNHLHFVWQQLRMNGRELPKNSFTKFTSKKLLDKLRTVNSHSLSPYQVVKSDRAFQVWKRDPLAVALPTKSIALQKLNYIHHNPLQSHWMLCQFETDYRFSSANFYSSGYDEFRILTHYEKLF